MEGQFSEVVCRAPDVPLLPSPQILLADVIGPESAHFDQEPGPTAAVAAATTATRKQGCNSTAQSG